MRGADSGTCTKVNTDVVVTTVLSNMVQEHLSLCNKSGLQGPVAAATALLAQRLALSKFMHPRAPFVSSSGRRRSPTVIDTVECSTVIVILDTCHMSHRHHMKCHIQSTTLVFSIWFGNE